MAEQELLVAERHAALREAFTRLPSRCQQLIALLIEDPPVPYAQISVKLGIPVGGIGPKPPPLPGKAASRSGDRYPDQHRSHVRGKRAVQAGNGGSNEDQ